MVRTFPTLDQSEYINGVTHIYRKNTSRPLCFSNIFRMQVTDHQHQRSVPKTNCPICFEIADAISKKGVYRFTERDWMSSFINNYEEIKNFVEELNIPSYWELLEKTAAEITDVVLVQEAGYEDLVSNSMKKFSIYEIYHNSKEEKSQTAFMFKYEDTDGSFLAMHDAFYGTIQGLYHHNIRENPAIRARDYLSNFIQDPSESPLATMMTAIYLRDILKPSCRIIFDNACPSGKIDYIAAPIYAEDHFPKIKITHQQ